MLSTRRSAPALCAVALALSWTGSARADDLVATVVRDTPISAYRGVVAWSDFDVATGRYALVLRQGGRTVRAAMPGATRPFDVSLGPDARGRLVAVYTRCRAATRGCDVFRYDVAARREARVAGVSSPSQDEAWPVQWRERLAFVRRARARDPRSGNAIAPCDVPFVKTLGSSAPPRRLDTGHCAVTIGMSIRGARIVQTTHADELETQVRLLRAGGGRPRVLARDVGGVNGDGELVSPSQSASAVWLTRTGNRAPSFFLRIDLPSGRLVAVNPQVELAGRVARDDRGSFWYVQAAQHGFDDGFGEPFCPSTLEPCRLVRASASPFSLTPRFLLPQMSSPAWPAGVVAPAAGPLTLSGDYTRPVVRRGRVVARQPLAGMPVDLRQGGGEDGGGPYAPTGLATATDAQGRWSFTVVTRPMPPFFVAIARDTGVASPPLAVLAGAA